MKLSILILRIKLGTWVCISPLHRLRTKSTLLYSVSNYIWSIWGRGLPDRSPSVSQTMISLTRKSLSRSGLSRTCLSKTMMRYSPLYPIKLYPHQQRKSTPLYSPLSHKPNSFPIIRTLSLSAKHQTNHTLTRKSRLNSTTNWLFLNIIPVPCQTLRSLVLLCRLCYLSMPCFQKWKVTLWRNKLTRWFFTLSTLHKLSIFSSTSSLMKMGFMAFWMGLGSRCCLSFRISLFRQFRLIMSK